MKIKDKLPIGEKVKYWRKKRGLTQAQLAEKLMITPSNISQIESGSRSPTLATIELIAKALEVDLEEIVRDPNSAQLAVDIKKQPTISDGLPDNVLKMPTMSQVPLVGTIACGSPILAAENIEGAVDLPEHIHADFALRCKGDSMINARIFDGDVVYIRQQETVESGEIAAVLIGDEATLKRVRLFPDHITLEPENPQYRPLVYWEEEMNSVRILGKAVAFTSTVR